MIKNGNNRHSTAGLIAAVCVVCVPITTRFEGTKLKPYHDPVGILTVCTGETQGVQNRAYTKPECAKLLDTDLVRKYAPAIISCVPTLTDPNRMMVFVASLDASYNAGTGAFCRSPMADRFRHKDWLNGCKRFVGWRDTAQGVRLPGLVTRRENEAELCMQGV